MLVIIERTILKPHLRGEDVKSYKELIPEESEYNDEGNPFKSYHVIDSDSSQFKAIIIQGGLHHLENYNQIVICLQEIKRILEPNGYLFISEPGNTLCLKISGEIKGRSPISFENHPGYSFLI